MFWKTVSNIYKKIAPNKFERMNKEMNEESLRILNESILEIKKGISLKEERECRIIISQVLKQLGYVKDLESMELIITVPQVLEFMGYESQSGTWDKNTVKNMITLKDLDNLMNNTFSQY
jgi:hypothetical protein|tara:strand:- start:2002 stop:2361 length:360 start_codon:yes stop_codon:yes gene_type:complete